MQKLFLGLAVLLAGDTVIATEPSPAPAAPKPNIVFILIDDMGDKDLGCTGSTYYETPNIDKLASEGMLFPNAYSAAPNCAPSRASIMTGMYGPRHGVYTVGDSDRGDPAAEKLLPVPNDETLEPKWKTIANVLHDAGYFSISIGKWHLGVDPETGPVGHGFDLNIAGDHRGACGKSYFPPYHNMPNLPDGPPGEYLTDRLTDEAIKFIDAHHDKPFFLYLPHYAVHLPLLAKPDLIAKYKNKPPGKNGQDNPIYAAMVDSVDQSVGRIMAKLDELHIADNTLVIFTSDNGGVAWGKNPPTSNLPLRGWKGMLYEGGIRVPFIARWPGHIAPGTTCDVPIIGEDIFPTLTQVGQGQLPTTQPVDGLSLVPLFEGATSLKRDALYWHFPCYLPGEGMGNGLRMTPASAMRMGDKKMIEYFEDNHLEMYDLQNDIGEKDNLVESNHEEADMLHQRMLQWRQKVNAPVPTQPNPKYDPSAQPKKQHKKKNGGDDSE